MKTRIEDCPYCFGKGFTVRDVYVVDGWSIVTDDCVCKARGGSSNEGE